jgi:membrane associated rhomboid family serine protease
MLPLRDDIPSRTFPAVTISLIVLNVLVFLYELMLGSRLEYLLLDFAVVPARYTDPDVARQFNIIEQAVPFLSSMFLHGGWLHLFGNMWILWIFGDNVEDRLGHRGFLALYLVSGFAAALLHIFTNKYSSVPTIGASGAVAGVMGAYFRFFPHARVDTVIPPFFFGPVFVLPAILFLGWWFLLQFLNGTMTLLARQGEFAGVAWWAHVGGFLVGVFWVLFAPRRPRKRSGLRVETGY